MGLYSSSRLEGQKLGVNSTPSFILNGKKLEGSVDLKVLLSIFINSFPYIHYI